MPLCFAGRRDQYGPASPDVVGVVGEAGEDLLAVDDPLVAVADRRGPSGRRGRLAGTLARSSRSRRSTRRRGCAGRMSFFPSPQCRTAGFAGGRSCLIERNGSGAPARLRLVVEDETAPCDRSPCRRTPLGPADGRASRPGPFLRTAAMHSGVPSPPVRHGGGGPLGVTIVLKYSRSSSRSALPGRRCRRSSLISPHLALEAWRWPFAPPSDGELGPQSCTTDASLAEDTR